MIYPIRYRIGSQHTLVSSTQAEVVKALRLKDEDHGGTYCYVVATYPYTGVFDGKTRTEGEPVFGFEITLNPQEVRFGLGKTRPAQVNWPGIGACSSDDAALFAALVTQAAQLVAEANAS